MNVCLSVSPAMRWRPIQGVPASIPLSAGIGSSRALRPKIGKKQEQKIDGCTSQLYEGAEMTLLKHIP